MKCVIIIYSFFTIRKNTVVRNPIVGGGNNPLLPPRHPRLRNSYGISTALFFSLFLVLDLLISDGRVILLSGDFFFILVYLFLFSVFFLLEFLFLEMVFVDLFFCFYLFLFSIKVLVRFAQDISAPLIVYYKVV